MANNILQKSKADEENKDIKQSTQLCPVPQPNPLNSFTLMNLQEIINLQRKIRKSKRIYIDVSGTKYEVVKEVAQELFTWNLLTSNDKINQEDWNICWYDTYINEDDLRKMLPYQKINHFPGSFNLGRKNYLGKNLCKMRKLFPEEYDFYPRTWLLPYQYEELRQYYERFQKQKPVFIIKPEASCQGRGIFLSKKIDTVLDPNDHYVVQEYVKNPYLIDGLKFDFRIYVMLKSLSPLKIFMFREGLARFATIKYTKPSKQNIHNMCMHLTNYAVNKKNPDFIFNTKEGDDNTGHKRSFTAVLKQIQEQGKDVNKLMMEIRKIIVKTLCSVQPYLLHLYKSCQPKEENNEMCFEVFGFDVMLDDKLKPLLLEVNHTPSFTCDTPLDYQIKKNLILDTLILSDIKHKEKLNYIEQKKAIVYLKGQGNKMTQQEQDQKKTKIDKYERKHLGGFIRIIPSDDDPTDYNMFIESAKSIHDEFTGTKKPPLKSNFVENNKDQQQMSNQNQIQIQQQTQQLQQNRPTSAKIKQIKPRPFSGIQKPTNLVVQKENNNNLNNSYTGPQTGICNQNIQISKQNNHQRKFSSKPQNQGSTLSTLQEERANQQSCSQYTNTSPTTTFTSSQQQQQIQYQIIEMPLQTLTEQLQQQQLIASANKEDNNNNRTEINQKLELLKKEIQNAQDEARRQLFSQNQDSSTNVGMAPMSAQFLSDSQREYTQNLNYYQNNRKNLSQTPINNNSNNSAHIQSMGNHVYSQYQGHNLTNTKFNVQKHEQIFGQIGQSKSNQLQKFTIRTTNQINKNINSSFNNDDNNNQIPLNIQKMRILPSNNKTVIESNTNNFYKEKVITQQQQSLGGNDFNNTENFTQNNRIPKGFTIKSKMDTYTNHQKNNKQGQKQLTSIASNNNENYENIRQQNNNQKHLNSYSTLRSNSYNNLLKNEEMLSQQQMQQDQGQFNVNGTAYQYPMNVNKRK